MEAFNPNYTWMGNPNVGTLKLAIVQDFQY